MVCPDVAEGLIMTITTFQFQVIDGLGSLLFSNVYGASCIVHPHVVTARLDRAIGRKEPDPTVPFERTGGWASRRMNVGCLIVTPSAPGAGFL